MDDGTLAVLRRVRRLGLVYQVAWVRQVLVIVGTTTAAVSAVLSVFMAGLGLWLFGRAADRHRAPLKLYAGLERGIGLYALLLPALVAASSPAYVHPDAMSAATSSQAPATDDRPTREFHRFYHPFQKYRGPFNVEQSPIMDLIHRSRGDHPTPLAGATAADVEAVAAWRRLDRQQALADPDELCGPVIDAGAGMAPAHRFDAVPQDPASPASGTSDPPKIAVRLLLSRLVTSLGTI